MLKEEKILYYRLTTTIQEDTSKGNGSRDKGLAHARFVFVHSCQGAAVQLASEYLNQGLNTKLGSDLNLHNCLEFSHIAQLGIAF